MNIFGVSMDQLNTSLTWHNAGKSVIKTVEMQTNRNARSLRLLPRGVGREEECVEWRLYELYVLLPQRISGHSSFYISRRHVALCRQFATVSVSECTSVCLYVCVCVDGN